MWDERGEEMEPFFMQLQSITAVHSSRERESFILPEGTFFAWHKNKQWKAKPVRDQYNFSLILQRQEKGKELLSKSCLGTKFTPAHEL